MLVFGGEG